MNAIYSGGIMFGCNVKPEKHPTREEHVARIEALIKVFNEERETQRYYYPVNCDVFFAIEQALDACIHEIHADRERSGKNLGFAVSNLSILRTDQLERAKRDKGRAR